MRLYASFETNGHGGYGDSFPAFFFAEWLKQNDTDNELEISMWDQGARGTGGDPDFRMRDHIKKPGWISAWLNGPPLIAGNYDAVLATHYNHPRVSGTGQIVSPMSDFWDPHYGGWLPPATYKDAKNLGILRLHNDAWWATLVDKLGWRPTLPTLIEEPPLPEEPFIAVQLRRDEPKFKHKSGRNALEGENHDRWARNFVDKFDGPVVLLSDQVEVDHPNIIDASGLTLWQKIYVAAHAEAFYGAHSGFGGICATYAKKSYVINHSEVGAYRNPPLVLFDNVKCPAPCDTYTACGPYVDQAGDYVVTPC